MDSVFQYFNISGSGLGKNMDGVVKPVEAIYKNDTKGLGSKTEENFSFEWWDHVNIFLIKDL
jgi:hypothetical protein